MNFTMKILLAETPFVALFVRASNLEVFFFL